MGGIWSQREGERTGSIPVSDTRGFTHTSASFVAADAELDSAQIEDASLQAVKGTPTVVLDAWNDLAKLVDGSLPLEELKPICYVDNTDSDTQVCTDRLHGAVGCKGQGSSCPLVLPTLTRSRAVDANLLHATAASADPGLDSLEQGSAAHLCGIQRDRAVQAEGHRD